MKTPSSLNGFEGVSASPPSPQSASSIACFCAHNANR
jgi:hypothetical protein